MKKQSSKLSLHRETLHHLATPATLQAAQGALSVTCKTCPTVCETVCTLRCTE